MNNLKQAIDNYLSQLEIIEGVFAEIPDTDTIYQLPERRTKHFVSKDESKNYKREDLNFQNGILYKNTNDDWSAWTFAKSEKEAATQTIEALGEQEFIETFT